MPHLLEVKTRWDTSQSASHISGQIVDHYRCCCSHSGRALDSPAEELSLLECVTSVVELQLRHPYGTSERIIVNKGDSGDGGVVVLGKSLPHAINR